MSFTCGVWIGLDLFNEYTRPSGHISRPTQVNVSQLLSFSKQITQSWLYCPGASRNLQIASDSGWLKWGTVYYISPFISDRRVLLLAQEFHRAILGNWLNESVQWV